MTGEPHDDLEQRRAELYSQLGGTGDFRPGSVNETWRRCGKPNCACAQPDNPWHGPRYLWTRSADGRTRTRQLAAAELDKVRREVAAYKQFVAVSEQIVQVNEAICEARPASVAGPGVQAGALLRLPAGAPLPDPLPAPPDVPTSFVATTVERMSAPYLSKDEQLAIIGRLEQALGSDADPADREIATHLLGQMASRTDLFAVSDRRIQELLRHDHGRSAIVEPGPAAEPPEAGPEPRLGATAVGPPVRDRSSSATGARTNLPRTSQGRCTSGLPASSGKTWSSRTSTRSSQAEVAGIFAVIGIAAWRPRP